MNTQQPTSTSATKLRRRYNTALITACLVGVAGILAGGIALVVGGGAEPQAQSEASDEVLQARIEFLAARDKYVELLSRNDRNPNGINTGVQTGWLQQVMGNLATEKAEAITQQRAMPNHPSFRKHESVGYALAEVNANEKLNLARLGRTATLHYLDSQSREVVEVVSSNKLAWVALGDLGAIDMAQTLPVRYNFSLDEIVTDVGQYQTERRLAYAGFLAAQNLTDASAELQTIQNFRQVINLPTPKPKAKPKPVGTAKSKKVKKSS